MRPTWDLCEACGRPWDRQAAKRDWPDYDICHECFSYNFLYGYGGPPPDLPTPPEPRQPFRAEVRPSVQLEFPMVETASA